MFRKLFYLSAIIFLIVAVYLKSKIIERKNSKEKLSITSEWAKFGKPVDAYKVVKKELNFDVKISGILKGDRIFCEVSPKIRYSLTNQQKFCLVSDNLFCGYIEKISNKMNIASGLYSAVLKLNKKLDKPNLSIIVTSVIIAKSIPKLLIPNDAVIDDKGIAYAFVINKENKVNKIKIKTGKTNQEYTEVIKGLNKNDLVIADGIQNLKENDLVRIYNTGAKL